jgi:hypothetical protein
MISSSEDEYETSAEQNSNIRNSACSITLENLEDQNKSVLKPSTPQKDVEAEDLEEGEILSDTDEDIPEMEVYPPTENSQH